MPRGSATKAATTSTSMLRGRRPRHLRSRHGRLPGIRAAPPEAGPWKIDRRVHLPGLNDAGDPHRPGWIDFRDCHGRHHVRQCRDRTETDAQRQVPRHALDHSDGGPSWSSPEWARRSQSAAVGCVSRHQRRHARDVDHGHAGVVFLPGSADRALITRNGFAVLRLRDLAEPQLRYSTIPVASNRFDRSMTVSSDADHVAVSAGVASSDTRTCALPPTGRSSEADLVPGSTDTEAVTDVAYTANDTLFVLHGTPRRARMVPHPGHQGPGRAPPVHGSTSTIAPRDPGSLSVWPAP